MNTQQLQHIVSCPCRAKDAQCRGHQGVGLPSNLLGCQATSWVAKQPPGLPSNLLGCQATSWVAKQPPGLPSNLNGPGFGGLPLLALQEGPPQTIQKARARTAAIKAVHMGGAEGCPELEGRGDPTGADYGSPFKHFSNPREKKQMSNTGTTGRIPLWLVGTVVGTAAIGLLAVFFYGSYVGLGSSI
jgi:photosystem II PsbJ protein